MSISESKSRYDDAKFVESLLENFSFRFGERAIKLAIMFYLEKRCFKIVRFDDDDLPF